MKFILKRALATQNAQIAVQTDWIWDDKPVLQWDTDIKALQGQQTVVSTKEADLLTKRGLYDKTLDDIHARTVQAVAMFKVRYKHTPEKLAVVQNLSARGDSRDDVLSEAQDLISAWSELDPTWNPTKDNTLTALQALRATALDPQGTDFGKAKTAWRTQAETMNTQGAQLEQDCVDWYGEATRVFLAGTSNGDMIRGTIPTTASSPAAARPSPAPPAPAAKSPAAFLPWQEECCFFIQHSAFLIRHVFADAG